MTIVCHFSTLIYHIYYDSYFDHQLLIDVDRSKVWSVSKAENFSFKYGFYYSVSRL